MIELARIRTIKPEFWTDPLIVSLPFEARLFYIGLWNFADDFGCLEDEPLRLKLQILPNDNVDAESLVELMIEKGRIERLLAQTNGPTKENDVNNGPTFLHLVKFEAHQKIDKRATSKFGDPDTWTKIGFDLLPPNPPESPRIPPKKGLGMERKGKERNGMERNGMEYTEISKTEIPSTPEPSSVVCEFDEVWKIYPRRENRSGALKAFKLRRKSVSFDELKTSVGHYAASVAGQDPKFIMHGSTFFGPNDRWKDYLHRPPPARISQPKGSGNEFLDLLRKGKLDDETGSGNSSIIDIEQINLGQLGAGREPGNSGCGVENYVRG